MWLVDDFQRQNNFFLSDLLVSQGGNALISKPHWQLGKSSVPGRKSSHAHFNGVHNYNS